MPRSTLLTLGIHGCESTARGGVSLQFSDPAQGFPGNMETPQNTHQQPSFEGVVMINFNAVLLSSSNYVTLEVLQSRRY